MMFIWSLNKLDFEVLFHCICEQFFIFRLGSAVVCAMVWVFLSSEIHRLKASLSRWWYEEVMRLWGHSPSKEHQCPYTSGVGDICHPFCCVKSVRRDSCQWEVGSICQGLGRFPSFQSCEKYNSAVCKLVYDILLWKPKWTKVLFEFKMNSIKRETSNNESWIGVKASSHHLREEAIKTKPGRVKCGPALMLLFHVTSTS